jgi:uncharacterized protein YjbI with pentapeptide repeats
MANEEHLARLKQGVEAWNAWRGATYEEAQTRLKRLKQRVKSPDQWRKKNPHLWPDLCEADLRRTDLCGADLSRADLRGANLREADLEEAHLHLANLERADLYCVNLGSANLWEANLDRANLRETDLRGADFHRAFIGRTIFGAVDLRMVQGLEAVAHESKPRHNFRDAGG